MIKIVQEKIIFRKEINLRNSHKRHRKVTLCNFKTFQRWQDKNTIRKRGKEVIKTRERIILFPRDKIYFYIQKLSRKIFLRNFRSDVCYRIHKSSIFYSPIQLFNSLKYYLIMFYKRRENGMNGDYQ